LIQCNQFQSRSSIRLQPNPPANSHFPDVRFSSRPTSPGPQIKSLITNQTTNKRKHILQLSPLLKRSSNRPLVTYLVQRDP
jgi:hypothetical protein